ncbi:MAG: HNH endonuclease [bacterium]|nr:HNH endonuclease [bacterium]
MKDRKQYKAEWYKKNKERIKEQQKEYLRSENGKETKRLYYIRHREERLLYQKEYDSKHTNKPHPPSQRWRDKHEYKLWRESVYKRDGYTCQHCGTSGCKVYAHHIKEGKDYPELRYDVDNGICLCKKCHDSIHKL